MTADRTVADFDRPPPVWAAGGMIDEYRIRHPIGAGGMGEVFAGTDTRLKRPVAIKTLRPDLAARPGFRRRFLHEAEAVARIDHENVVPVYASGEAGGRPYLVMPLLRGRTLHDALTEPTPMPAAEVLRVGRQIALGLAAAHAQKIIHRDVKPANIWLEAGTGRAKLLDFGLARPADGSALQTRVGEQGLGTAGYMAPEQARGEPVDDRADLFGLGCVLYHLVAWREPFPGETVLAILEKVTREHPPAPGEVRPGLPPELAALCPLVGRLLAKDPADRDTTAARVADELGRLIGDDRPAAVARPRRLLAAGGVGLALGLVVVGFALSLWIPTDIGTPPPEPTRPRPEVVVVVAPATRPVETPAEVPPPKPPVVTPPAEPDPPPKPVVVPPPPPPPFASLDAGQIPPDHRPANAGAELAAVVRPPRPTLPRPWELAAAGNGSVVALFGEGELRLFDGKTLAAKTTLPLTLSRYAPRPLRPAVAVSADGSRLAVCDRSAGRPLVRVFDLTADPPRDAVPVGPPAGAEHGLAAFAPTGRTLYVVWQPAQAVERYDCPDTGPQRTAQVPFLDAPSPEDVWSMAVSPDGRLLAIATRRGTVRVFDLSGKEPTSLGLFAVRSASGGEARVQFVADRELTVAAETFALTISRGTVRAESRGEPAVSAGVSFPCPVVESAVARPAGRVYAAHADGVLRGWDVSAATPVRLPAAGQVRRIALSPDGHWLAVETVGPGLTLYRLTDATPTAFPLTLGGPTDRLAFDGSQRLVAVRPAARRMWWDVSGGEPVTRADGVPAPPDPGDAPRPTGLALPGDVIAVRRTADGRGLAAATPEAVYLYRVGR